MHFHLGFILTFNHLASVLFNISALNSILSKGFIVYNRVSYILVNERLDMLLPNGYMISTNMKSHVKAQIRHQCFDLEASMLPLLEFNMIFSME